MIVKKVKARLLGRIEVADAERRIDIHLKTASLATLTAILKYKYHQGTVSLLSIIVSLKYTQHLPSNIEKSRRKLLRPPARSLRSDK